MGLVAVWVHEALKAAVSCPVGSKEVGPWSVIRWQVLEGGGGWDDCRECGRTGFCSWVPLTPFPAGSLAPHRGVRSPSGGAPRGASPSRTSLVVMHWPMFTQWKPTSLLNLIKPTHMNNLMSLMVGSRKLLRYFIWFCLLSRTIWS